MAQYVSQEAQVTFKIARNDRRQQLPHSRTESEHFVVENHGTLLLEEAYCLRSDVL